jgi:hypothetical protein
VVQREAGQQGGSRTEEAGAQRGGGWRHGRRRLAMRTEEARANTVEMDRGGWGAVGAEEADGADGGS